MLVCVLNYTNVQKCITASFVMWSCKNVFLNALKVKLSLHLFRVSSCRGELVQPVSDLRQSAAANPAPSWCDPGDQVQRKWQALAPSLRLPEGQARGLLCSHPAGTRCFWEEGGEAWLGSVTACWFSVGETAGVAHTAVWSLKADRKEIRFSKIFSLHTLPSSHTLMYTPTRAKCCRRILSFISTITLPFIQALLHLCSFVVLSSVWKYEHSRMLNVHSIPHLSFKVHAWPWKWQLTSERTFSRCSGAFDHITWS